MALFWIYLLIVGTIIGFISLFFISPHIEIKIKEGKYCTANGKTHDFTEGEEDFCIDSYPYLDCSKCEFSKKIDQFSLEAIELDIKNRNRGYEDLPHCTYCDDRHNDNKIYIGEQDSRGCMREMLKTLVDDLVDRGKIT